MATIFVRNIGYLNLVKIKNLIDNNLHFSIYKTYKNRDILVTDTFYEKVELYYPKYDRLPYKLVEGKSITGGELIFNSKKDEIENIDFTNWNNKNQIISYNQYNIF